MRLSIFVLNLKALFAALIRHRIDWLPLASVADDTIFDKTAKVYSPFKMKDVKVGRSTYISPNSCISLAEIGSFCSIGPNFLCGFGIHPTNGISTSPVFYSTKKQTGFTFTSANKIKEREKILIGNDVFIGMNVTVLDGISIGDGAVIGAGAVVSKDIPPYAIAVGSPIKIIKYRFEPSIVEKLMKLKWWDGDESLLKQVENNFFNIEEFLSALEENNKSQGN